ncbi:hypothetical protein QTP88_010665 [Uroleucon formosanum]
MGFQYQKRSRNSAMIEKDDIVVWHREYLKSIKKYREEGHPIYYMDETWVNSGDCTSQTWVDKTVTSRTDAFSKGLSTGPTNPSGRGKRLIVVHIGNEDGFVPGGLLCFESKKNTKDYHDEMNGEVFLEWMETVLPRLKEYENRFPGRRVPAPAMFARIHQALRDRGTFRRSLREGVHNADLEREILDEVNRDPETSTRALACQFGVHHTTVWRTINREGLYPYYFLRVHGLENTDHQQRVQFCRWLLHNEVEDCNFLQSIIWTDESTFTREGVFNVHNRHYYVQENPHLVCQQRFQRRFSINVWMGVIGGVLIGPFLALPRTVGGNAYLNFLQNELSVLLKDIPLDVRRRMIHQHDGAPPHFSRAIRQHLNETFTSWIGRGGTIPWPPRSPDLTPLDFFVWGYLKERVYQQEVDSEAELRQRILQAAIEMRRVITAGVTGSQVRKRAHACLRQNGGHFE